MRGGDTRAGEERDVSDVVVTVPAKMWADWLAEGQLPDEPWDGSSLWAFTVPTLPRRLEVGQRVYVVAGRRLRGYAPLMGIEREPDGRYALLRGASAVAVTIDVEIPGFRGYRYRWWDRTFERPYPEWRDLSDRTYAEWSRRADAGDPRLLLPTSNERRPAESRD